MAENEERFTVEVSSRQDTATIKVFKMSSRECVQVANIHVGIYDGMPKLVVTAKQLSTEIFHN